ncbi:tail protein [Streptomyces phage Muntaha]|uniref:Major tail protein n=1 Tax=Streptomyces phage Muntaha TaxID=2713269 RepID=A0A6G8R346_9CAUD|nr:tail protein [Streptomyces phage Muntaha]QIN94596.1 major tail protein [Streptomyces phage Muntaha]
MNGIYRFYQGGKLIAEHKNLITNEGKRLVLRYMAGQSPSLGGGIALGVGGLAASTSDVRLRFEIYRANVLLRNADYSTNRVLFKGEIEQEVEFTIYEAGLWSTTSNTLGTPDSQIITTFDLETEAWTNVTTDSTNARTSASAVRVDAGASSTTSPRVEADLDLSGYSTEDEFALAIYKPDGNVTDVSLVFANAITGGQFKLTKSIAALTNGAYHVVYFRKGDFVATGSISWDNIDTLGVDVTAGTTGGYVILDGIRVEDTDTPDQDHILVSRTVLTSPLVKTSTAPMEVEYSLEFNVA